MLCWTPKRDKSKAATWSTAKFFGFFAGRRFIVPRF